MDDAIPHLIAPQVAGSAKLPDIEALRGIAVLMVMLVHWQPMLIAWDVPLWQHIRANYLDFWPGVDIFFAISGFVIARSLLPKLRAATTNTAFGATLVQFWIRRVWRLLPAAWLWLAFVLLCSAIFNRSGAWESFHTNFESVIAGALAVADFRFAARFAVLPYGSTSHYWSLSLEEQFYSALPVVVFLSGRRLVAILLLIAAILCALPETIPLMAFRAHAMVFGVLLAIFAEQPLYQRMNPAILANSRAARWAVLWGSLFFMAALAPLFQKITAIRPGLIAIIATALVFVASYGQHYIWAPGITKRALLWVGSRSYGIYLIHAPIFTFTRELWFRLLPNAGPGDAWKLIATAIPLVLVLSELNFRLVERPLRDVGKRIAARQG